jgi:chorismate mutase
LGDRPTLRCRGIRGATTAPANTADAILSTTRELLERLIEANGVSPEDVSSALFTMTPDLTAAFPARAARQLGWQHVPLLDAQEIPVPGSLPRCIRVLVHWNTRRSQAQIRHIYLRDAAALRPDLAAEAQIDT